MSVSVCYKVCMRRIEMIEGEELALTPDIPLTSRGEFCDC